MINYENEIAVKCGVNAALIADYLWNMKQDHRFSNNKSTYRHGKVWVRCSQPMITSDIRFLSIDMVKGAVKTLVEKNILRKAYMPYYKWSNKRLSELSILGSRIAFRLDVLAADPQKKDSMIESVSADIIEEFRKEGLTSSSSDYLFDHAVELQKSISSIDLRRTDLFWISDAK